MCLWLLTNTKKYVECYQHFLFCIKVLPYPMNIPLLRNIKISWDLITFHNLQNWFLVSLRFNLRRLCCLKTGFSICQPVFSKSLFKYRNGSQILICNIRTLSVLSSDCKSRKIEKNK